VLARDGSSALVLDAGTGLRRLITAPELLAGVERIDTAPGAELGQDGVELAL
jgi:hypothetical protein